MDCWVNIPSYGELDELVLSLGTVLFEVDLASAINEKWKVRVVQTNWVESEIIVCLQYFFATRS